jgi:hypothetical protein
MLSKMPYAETLPPSLPSGIKNPASSIASLRDAIQMEVPDMSNIVDKYRSTHRKLRRYLQPYTDRLCPVCPAPCCRKPTKVAEFDVLLANACGCSLPSANEAALELIDKGFAILAGTDTGETSMEPCDYLGEKGCMFPEDLRPFECARYMCPFLKEEIKPGEMREIRDLLHKLGVIHRELRDATNPRPKR